MKPFTIDELKALQVGDWVWVVDKETPLLTGYYQIHGFAKTHIHFNREACIRVVPKALYGKDWLAYKNKEQAEAKGEIVELPCKIGDMVWAINAWVEYGDQTKGEPYTITRYELVEGMATGFRIYNSGQVKKCEIIAHAPEHGVRTYVFTDKSQAEARLAELRGEK